MKTSTDKYQLVVGNVGTVYSGSIWEQAYAEYLKYESMSESAGGRCAGEDVTLFADGEPRCEHTGWLSSVAFGNND